MKTNFKSYPHPVLKNGDDINGTFEVIKFNYELTKEEIILNSRFELENKALEGLVRSGKASYVLEIECPDAFFRTYAKTNTPIVRVVIPAKRLREKVTVGFYICANEDMSDYKPTECHPDYMGATFEIEEGDVLAIGGSCSFIAEKTFDPLRPPVSSFFTITAGSFHQGPMQIEYDSAKIGIILSKSDYQEYSNVRNQNASHGILHASIVFPALMDAIYQVKAGNDSEYSKKNWFVRLEKVLEEKKLEDKEPFESAQKILDNPLARSFSGINSLLDLGNEQEYEQ